MDAINIEIIRDYQSRLNTFKNELNDKQSIINELYQNERTFDNDTLICDNYDRAHELITKIMELEWMGHKLPKLHMDVNIELKNDSKIHAAVFRGTPIAYRLSKGFRKLWIQNNSTGKSKQFDAFFDVDEVTNNPWPDYLVKYWDDLLYEIKISVAT